LLLSAPPPFDFVALPERYEHERKTNFMLPKQSFSDKSLLRRARQRYHALPIPERPALAGNSVVGLFDAPELLALAQVGRWPLGEEDFDFLREPPPARRRQRRSRQTQLLSDLADLAREQTDVMRNLLWLLLKTRKVGHAEAE
jgi:hypothetical protein